MTNKNGWLGAHRCGADTEETRCTRKSVETRLWAGVITRFCKAHAKLWDETVTWALIDFYTERNGEVPTDE